MNETSPAASAALASPAAIRFCQQLEERFNQRWALAGTRYRLHPVIGRAFDRIEIWTEVPGSRNQLPHPTTHAFVERETGWVYQHAGWGVPTTDVRFTRIEDAIALADPFGHYLTLRGEH